MMTAENFYWSKGEKDFKIIGLYSFFYTENDKNINWEEFFNLTEDEEFYKTNNNLIIEDDKSEDRIWTKYQ